jgi:MFS family permease
LFAFAVVLVTAFISDRFKSRSIPMLFHTLLALSGYVWATVAGSLQAGPIVRYLATFPICGGFFSAVTVVITWTINNQASDEGKGTGMAILQIIGQMGPLVGTRLYPDSAAPYFVWGNAACALAMAVAFGLTVALRFVLIRENNRRIGVRWREVESEALMSGRRNKEFVFIT